MEQVKTILLRFRDLVTSQGETIIQHADIAEKDGKVWWGWWSKQNEHVPLDIFASLLQQIKTNKKLDVYLIDTGSLSVYKAECIDIKYETSRGELSTPNEKLTPEYYKNTTYQAWFCFSNIDKTPIDAKILNSFSYILVDSFFIDPTIVNQFPFKDKKVATLQELKLQDRTMWFVRDAQTTDLSHEIQLATINKLQPSHFTKEFKNTSHSRLLWFTDIHFGSSHGFIQASAPNNQQKPLWHAVQETCEIADRKDIAGVIVSGDITTHAEKQGFDNAYDFFFAPLCSVWTENDFYNWIICPGNHDFGFLADAIPVGEELKKPIEITTEEYSSFYNKLFGLPPNHFFCSGRRFLIGNAYPVEIIALNSLNLQQVTKQFQGYGFVGDEQLDFAQHEYSWKATNGKTRKPIRIVALHHHLLPVSYTESTKAEARYSISLDAESLTRWMLEHEVTLVLHGHMHQPYITYINRPLTMDKMAKNPADWPSFTVCALGSGGVKKELLGEVGKNMFGVITFDNDEIQIEFFELNPVVRKSHKDPLYKVCLPI